MKQEDADTLAARAVRKSLTEILALDDLAHETVWVAKWGTSVEVRELTADEQLAIQDACTTGSGRVQRQLLIKRMVQTALVDPPCPDMDSCNALFAKSAAAMGVIAQAVQRLCKASEEDAKAAEAEFQEQPA